MNYHPKFGDFIDKYLARQERSASWLATRLKVNPATVTRWLNEHTRPGSPEVVVQIADILRIEKSELLIAAGYGYKEMPNIEEQVAEEKTEESIDNSSQTKRGGGNHFNGHIEIYGDVIEGSTVHKTVYYSTDNAKVQKETKDIIQDEDSTKSS